MRGLAREAALVGKLARTYAIQMDQLQSMKGRRKVARQSITVKKELHQHVHYHDDRGVGKAGGQPQGTPGSTTSAIPALPSPDEVGRVVPLSRRSRA